MKLRRIKQPNRFVRPKDAARFLRQMADRIEGHDGGLVAARVDFDYASEEDVRHSLEMDAKKAAKR